MSQYRVYLDADAYKLLNDFCEKNKASKKGVVSEAIRHYLVEIKK